MAYTNDVQVEVGVRVASNQRSCLTCPSATTDSNFVAGVGKGIGSTVCSLKLLPITRPNQKTSAKSKSAEVVAKGCDSYGKPRKDFVESAFEAPAPIEVGMGDGGNQEDPTRLGNCRSCVSFVQEREVFSATGWNAGLCKAKGILLLTDRLDKYARDCPVSEPRKAGSNTTLDGFMFNPEYTQDFGFVNVSKLSRQFREVEPANWPTDRPVGIKAAERGIIAWRKIVDPEGYSDPIYLPIYNKKVFGDREDLVPVTGSDEHPELYTDHDGLVFTIAGLWRELDMTPALWGMPGTGKTELARHLAWLMQLPFTRISITGSSEIDDIAGKWVYDKEKGTYFQYGRLPHAWSLPNVICLDEPNVGPPDVWQFIRPLTDNSKQLVLDQSAGEKVERHNDCYFLMAMNPPWDSRNVGAQTIGDADARRLMHINVGLPPEDVERDIIMRWCKTASEYDPSAHMSNIMQISKDIRAISDQGDIPITWGVANNIKVARAMKVFPPMKAYQIAVLNYLDPSIAMQVSEVIKSMYGS